MVSFLRRVGEAIAREECDIVHAISPMPTADIYQPRGGLLPEIVARNVATRPTASRRLFKRAMLAMNVKQRSQVALERRIFREGGPVIACVSEYVARQCREHYGAPEDRIRVIFNGVNPAPLSDDELAAVVDHANPGMHDGLATAVQFARGEVGDEFSNSPRLIEETLREACARAQGVPFLGVLNHRGARQRLTELLSLFALTGAVWIMTPELMNTWFLRNWLLRDVAWPQQTQIIPVGFDESGAMRWPIGDELEIRADLYGKPPQRVLPV